LADFDEQLASFYGIYEKRTALNKSEFHLTVLLQQSL